jgi:hypothetical protein
VVVTVMMWWWSRMMLAVVTVTLVTTVVTVVVTVTVVVYSEAGVVCDKQEIGIINNLYYALKVSLVWLSWLECCLTFQEVLGSNLSYDILNFFF